MVWSCTDEILVASGRTGLRFVLLKERNRNETESWQLQMFGPRDGEHQWINWATELIEHQRGLCDTVVENIEEAKMESGPTLVRANTP